MAFQMTTHEVEAMAAMGGQIVEIIPGEKVVVKFPSTDKMLELIALIKKSKRIKDRLRLNSKVVDGENLLTFSRT